MEDQIKQIINNFADLEAEFRTRYSETSKDELNDIDIKFNRQKVVREIMEAISEWELLSIKEDEFAQDHTMVTVSRNIGKGFSEIETRNATSIERQLLDEIGRLQERILELNGRGL